MARVFAYRGNHDGAFEYLDQRMEKGGPGSFGEQRLNPLFTSIGDGPRWEKFLVEMGVSDDQPSQRSFTVTLPETTE